jgi:signal transduction histidine kinase
MIPLRSPAARYGVALLVVAAALLVRLQFDPLWGVTLPFFTFYPAVVLAAWLGGLGPGLTATVASALAARYLWMAPVGAGAVAAPGGDLAIGLFCVNGLLMASLAEALHRANRRLAANTHRIEDLNRQLEGRVADLQAARADAQAAGGRWEFLAGASRELAASLDYETTLSTVARLAVPVLADFCFFDLLRADGRLERVAWAHVDPRRQALLHEAARYAPPVSHPTNPIAAAVRTGRAQLVPEVSEAWLQAAAVSPAHLAFLRALEFGAFLSVPLIAGGRTLGALTCCRLTASGHRYAPADLRLAEELAHRAALAVDHARLYQEVQAAVRARDDFLARASHELRTPLTAALGSVRLLRKALAGLLQESPEALLTMAGRSLHAMAGLIDDLLDASKLAAGAERLATRPLDLAAAIAAGVEVVAPQAREKGVALEVRAPGGLALAGDRVRLEQVVVNLLANAIKFTPAGGAVTVEAQQDTDGVRIRVCDTGEGIAPDQLERIFEPFYQAGGLGDAPVTDRRNRRGRGAGLGLAICREIVSLHGGRIWAESEGPGRGSTFVVLLPQAGTGSAAA